VKRDVWLYAVALVVGVGTWLAVSHVAGKREAWDSEVYFSFGMPVVCVVSLLLGAAEPRAQTLVLSARLDAAVGLN
jgi:hypothetical protein